MKKIIFPVVIIFSLLILDGFLLNDLQVESEKKFPNFKTVTLDGEEVTEKIFENKITALCLWTTNQEICYKILPELESMQKNFSNDVQFICLVGDVRTNEIEKFPAAKNIAEKFSPNILQLAVNDDFSPVLEKIRTIPTTIFIDKNKFLVGQPAGGTDSKFILRELHYILQKDSPKFSTQKKIHEIILDR